MTTRFRLRELLEDRGMTQAELIRQSGVSIRTVTRLCTNETRRVDLDTLDRIAAVLKVPPGALIEATRRRG